MAFPGSGAFDAPAPVLTRPSRTLRRLGARTYGRLRRVVRIFSAPLPPDVIDCEVSVVVLFRASQALNCLTGGRGEMTFSSRCHLLARRARTPSIRLVWRVTEGVIDASCGALRGETAHCETAWENFRARGRRSAR